MSIKKTSKVAMRDEGESKAETLLSCVASLRASRKENEKFYLEASKLFAPTSAPFWCNTKRQSSELSKNHQVFTSVCVKAVERGTNFLLSSATPSSGSWWEIGRVDGMSMASSLKKSSKSVTQKVQTEQRESLYIALGKAFREMFVSYGVVYQGVRRDYGERQKKVFYEHVPSHNFWFRKNIYGEMFEASYCRSISVEAYYQEYGEWPEGYASKDERKNRKSQFVTVVAIVRRNRDFKESPQKPEDHEFVEYHIDENEKKIVSKRGHKRMPFYVFPMRDVPNSDYPIGIVYDALPDARMANAARAAQATAFAYLHRPPILTNMRDAISRYGKQLRPGQFIEEGIDENGQAKIQPVQGLYNAEVMAYAIADDEARVNSVLWQNDLISTHSPDMTATQATLVAAERQALVAPFINNIMPVLERMCEAHIEIHLESGDTSNGEEFAELDLEINVISPMAMLGRSHDLASLNEALAHMANAAQIKPEIVAAIDEVKVVEAIANGTGTEHVLNAKMIETARRGNDQAQQLAAAQGAERVEAENVNLQADALGKVKELVDG